MSYHVKQLFLFAFYCFVILSCNGRKEEKELYLAMSFSENLVGKQAYNLIYKQASDSINSWINGDLKTWEYEELEVSIKIDSILCINKSQDKLVTALLAKTLDKNYYVDGVHFFYGVKIEEKWYFFKGPYMVIPRDKENLNTPTSFTKLHEIAMDTVFKGYLKKNEETGEWEINDAFFAALTGNGGCADCKTQAQWDSTYLATVRENWKHRDTTHYKPLQ